MSLVGKVIGSFVERDGRKASMSEWASRLTTSGESIAGRMAAVKDTTQNRDVVTHIVGIERWGQSRLQTLLGEPLRRDEYDIYRPDATQNLAALVEIFRQVRTETVGLIGQLEVAGCDPGATAPHNDIGGISIVGWLSYLSRHASIESRKLR